MWCCGEADRWFEQIDEGRTENEAVALQSGEEIVALL
jgi:hypothetical protein